MSRISRISAGTGIPVPVIIGIVLFFKIAILACLCKRFCCKKKRNNDRFDIQAPKPNDADQYVYPQPSLNQVTPSNTTQSFSQNYPYTSDSSVVFGNTYPNMQPLYPPIYPMQPIGLNPPYPTGTNPGANIIQTAVDLNPAANPVVNNPNLSTQTVVNSTYPAVTPETNANADNQTYSVEIENLIKSLNKNKHEQTNVSVTPSHTEANAVEKAVDSTEKVDHINERNNISVNPTFAKGNVNEEPDGK